MVHVDPTRLALAGHAWIGHAVSVNGDLTSGHRRERTDSRGSGQLGDAVRR